MDYLILALPTLPLLSAVLVFFLFAGHHNVAARFSVVSMVFTFFAASMLLTKAVTGEPSVTVQVGEHWGVFLFDPLSSLMCVVISGISLVVHVYSIRYMSDEPGYTRFYMLLGIMTSALLLMVLAGDMISLLVAWHLIGILLYFLLGHDTENQPAQRYAMWTLVTYRLGDLPLILAVAVLYQAYGTWSLPELFALVAQSPDVTTVAGFRATELAGGLIALSAFARSAQFLLHGWLPYTMSGPTPVSALMHAGIVNAGGFLINRFAPVYMHTQDILHLLFIVGLVTAIIGSMLMLSQNDIKKALGYSTMGQMGFMIMECGVGAFSLAVFHLIAHGLFKGTLFLGAGMGIAKARASDGIPKNSLYTFVVERSPKSRKQPWQVMAALTLLTPLVILLLAHWLVEQDYFQKQGAIVLLFFGWITGAQLIFTSYKMQASNPWRLFGMVIASFAIVVVGYALISHAFDLFLYPDSGNRELLYAAADVGLIWFDLFVILVTAVIVSGWLLVYYQQRSRQVRRLQSVVRANLYALISREFFVLDIQAWIGRKLLLISARLNAWMRWL